MFQILKSPQVRNTTRTLLCDSIYLGLCVYGPHRVQVEFMFLVGFAGLGFDSLLIVL